MLERKMKKSTSERLATSSMFSVENLIGKLKPAYSKKTTLKIDIHRYQQHILEVLDYQNFDSCIKINKILIKSFSLGVKLLTKTMIEGTKSAVMGHVSLNNETNQNNSTFLEFSD